MTRYTAFLPPALSKVTAFRVGRATFQFRALLMGLFISPRILQATVQAALLPMPGVFSWVHLDDIFICRYTELVHSALVSAFRRLGEFGFNISINKSQLVPSQRIRYCGLLISSCNETFEVGHTHLWFIRRLLFSGQRMQPYILGYVSYWLYAVHLTAAVRRLVAKRPDVVWRLLDSGPWPLPRPPEQFMAIDASEEWLAAVDGRGTQVFILPAPGGHISFLEMLALFLAVLIAAPTLRLASTTKR